MTSTTTNKFSPEVRARAVRLVQDHEGDHASRWAAISSRAAKIGCSPHTLLEWVKKALRPSSSRRWNGSTGSITARLLEPIGNIPPAEAEQGYYTMLEQTELAA